MRIGPIDLVKRVLVVAEIGNNHEGNVEVARELVRRAAAAGADAVKFQTFRTKYFVSARDRARYDRLSSFQLSYDDFADLQRLARSLGLLFISTPLDLESAAFLAPLVDAVKIASGDNNFYPLLTAACRSDKPIIMSTGLSDLDQIRKSQRFIEERWREFGVTQELAVLHCVTSYPTPPEQANVAAVPYLAAELGCIVGYSDHTLGIDACVAAVALGARLIEKHFTLDRAYSDFRDHQLSADPTELAELVQRIARVQVLVGTRAKVVQPAEAAIGPLVRRSIVAAGDLAAGHRLDWNDLTWIRPADGLPPGDEDKLLGRTLKRAVVFGEPLLPSDVE